MRQQIGWLLVLISVSFVLTEKQNKPYLGHKVLRIKPSSGKDVQTLTNLEHELQLDFWHLPHSSQDGHMDVRVGPKFIDNLKDRLKKLNLEFEELISDVQLLVDRESRSIKRSKRAINSLVDYTTKYLSYSEINQFLTQIDAQVSSTQLMSIGQTVEGRNTYVIKIGYPATNNINKPAIFIDAGFHAREWIAPATAINFIYQLAVNPKNDPQVTDLLTKFDFYIAPIVNPDGYEYSKQSVRLWRKNRRQISSTCYGVDINRNFGYHWNPLAGGSTYPCSDLYAGSSGFSEPESRNIRNFMLTRKQNIKGYLTLHSYGQYWLYPWGYTNTIDAIDKDTLHSIAVEAVSAMDEEYTIGSSAKKLYIAAGGSDDFAKGAAGIPYSYTVELPPGSFDSRGFLLPVSEIPRVAQDTFKGLKAFANSVYSVINTPRPSPPTTTKPTPSFTLPAYWPAFFQQLWWNNYRGK